MLAGSQGRLQLPASLRHDPQALKENVLHERHPIASPPTRHTFMAGSVSQEAGTPTLILSCLLVYGSLVNWDALTFRLNRELPRDLTEYLVP
jgi:hypothetical protein